jgi:hypothetical protein
VGFFAAGVEILHFKGFFMLFTVGAFEDIFSRVGRYAA